MINLLDTIDPFDLTLNPLNPFDPEADDKQAQCLISHRTGSYHPCSSYNFRRQKKVFEVDRTYFEGCIKASFYDLGEELLSEITICLFVSMSPIKSLFLH